jgi:carbohydrate-selective porin OprB
MSISQDQARFELFPAALCSAAILFLCATPGHAEGHVEGRKALDGLRGVIEPKGVSIEADYVGEWVSDHSGAAEGKSFYLDTANIVVKLDLEKAFGWRDKH